MTDNPKVNLHDTTDAAAWAREFCKVYPAALFKISGKGGVTDGDDFEHAMLGWFANAIMAGVDSEANKAAAIAAMQPALAEAEARGRNEGLREALSHKWLCFHKCNNEEEVVSVSDIVALIDAETDLQPDLSGTSEPAPAPEVTVQQAAQVMLDGAKSGRPMDSEKSGRAMHAACDAYEITDHLSIPRIVDAVVGAWLRSLAQEGET